MTDNRINPTGGPVTSAVVQAVSPTGTPVLKPAIVPYAAAGLAALAAIQETIPDGPVKHWLGFGLMVLGPILAMFSPGLRRSP